MLLGVAHLFLAATGLPEGGVLQPEAVHGAQYAPFPQRAQYPPPAGASGTSRPEKQHFVVFGLARCGSEWLISMLNKHPNVGIGVIEPLTESLTPPSRVSSTLQGLLTGQLPNGHVLPRAEEKAALGFKWFNHQNFDIAEDVAAAPAFGEYLKTNRFKAVFLRRNSSLAREVSLAKMHATDSHVCEDAACQARMAATKVTLDPQRVVAELEAADRQWEGMLAWVSHQFVGAQRLHVLDYESLAANPQLEVQRIFSFLGVDVPDVGQIDSEQTLRMSSASTADAIENLGEVRQAVAGTKWAAEIAVGGGPWRSI